MIAEILAREDIDTAAVAGEDAESRALCVTGCVTAAVNVETPVPDCIIDASVDALRTALELINDD